MIQLVLSPDVKNILIIETSLSILSGHQTGKISICKLCSTAVFQCSTVTYFLQPAASFPMVIPWQASCTCCTAFLAFATAALRRFLAVTVAILATLGEASSGEEKASHVAVGTISSAMGHWGWPRKQRLTSMTDKRSHSFMNEWMKEALTEWVKNERMSESVAWLSRRNGWWFTHLWTKLSSLYTVYANSSSKSGPTIMRWKEMRHPNRAVAFSDIFFRPWHVSVYLGRLLTSIPFL